MKFLSQIPLEVKLSAGVVLGPPAAELPAALVETQIPGFLPQGLVNQNP